TLFKNLKIRIENTQQEFKALHAISFFQVFVMSLFNMLLLYAALYCVGWIGIYSGENLKDYFLGLVCATSIAGAIPFMPSKTGFGLRLVKIGLGCVAVLGLGYLTQWEMKFWLPTLSCVATPLLFWLIFKTRLTPKGAELKARVEGLARYLAHFPKKVKDPKAESDSLKQYQELLPYAVALGLDQTFKEQWQEILKLRQTSEKQNEFTDDDLSYMIDDQEEVLDTLNSIIYTYGASQDDSDSSNSSDSGSSDGGGGGW
ncbi:MAG: DUF2207 domain-containing protein, partial [Desulfovibrionaceae bacterium]|nr:DUF2207 domain-containing protein [Desulfovibrionaceae bacterium]